MKKVFISTEYITLGQFLKAADIIPTGGAAKWFLQENEVFVNGEAENRRGKKLVPGDQVEIPGVGLFQVLAQ
ncbi:S4 domain-containing protein YaaA [Ectobacillus ponti]|uniref:S4 domain-containing protein YaaA n=1 Tax=Ectobacillus ponti TaxID=2961894 RepID=A0AA41XCL1_9BACI|nr:S4 domain-containing protein YaaA [Ectobacillus ponti]MCP8971208.1 S4 domain-containing protein YaaA [Ectobacillus ponti]